VCTRGALESLLFNTVLLIEVFVCLLFVYSSVTEKTQAERPACFPDSDDDSEVLDVIFALLH
jgi:hypothetical protein